MREGGADGAGTNSENVRDLVLRQVGVVAKEQRVTFLVRESGDQRPKLGPLGRLAVRPKLRRLFVAEATPPPLLLTAGVQHRLPQPAFEAALPTERLALPERRRKRLLHRFACKVVTTEYREAETEKPGVATAINLLECSLGRAGVRPHTNTMHERPESFSEEADARVSRPPELRFVASEDSGDHAVDARDDDALDLDAVVQDHQVRG